MKFPTPSAATRLLVLSLAAALTAPALASPDEDHGTSGYGFAPGYYVQEQARFHDYIARMSPENRAKLAAMQDKLMQMQMDNSTAMMKMDMELAKARRDMEMFIMSTGYPKEYGH